MILRLHKRAEDEIREAVSWYRDRGAGLDRQFLAAVREALESLESDAPRFAKLETFAEGTPFRRVLVRGFPYLVIFELFDAEVFSRP